MPGPLSFVFRRAAALEALEAVEINVASLPYENTKAHGRGVMNSE